MAEFRRGFKAWSERTALGFRRDLQTEPFGALDPYELARHLDILVWTPHDVARLGDLAKVSLDQLLKHDPSSWSAVTLILPRNKEEEADWLSGVLLVPRDGLLEMLSHNRRNENAASHFNVSTQMIEWRRRMTGIDRQLSRRRSG